MLPDGCVRRAPSLTDCSVTGMAGSQPERMNQEGRKAGIGVGLLPIRELSVASR